MRRQLRRARGRTSAAGLLLVLVLGLSPGGCRHRVADDGALSALVAELVPRIEAASGMRRLAPVKVARRSRADLRAYIVSRMNRELPPDVLRGLQASYRAFGLLPDTVDLRRLLLDLYTEQVIGFYDPGSRTLYVVEGSPPKDVESVVAHELVHALQDQHVNLDSLLDRRRGNDHQSAAQAAVEGQAMLVMFALEAQDRAGRAVDVAALPDLSGRLRPALEQENAQFPVFRRAPRIVRETLLFPYFQGAAFVQQLWRAADTAGVRGARPVPFDTLLPVSTEQVLHPSSRFLARRDAPTELTLGPPAAGWTTVYENTLGELELSILMEQHLGPDGAGRARGWDGDRFRLEQGPAGGRALVLWTVWDDAASADSFAAAYRRILERRPSRRGTVERLQRDGRPLVRIVDAAVSLDPSAVPIPALVGMQEDGGP